MYQTVIEGMYSDPIYGGNRNKAGWAIIGFPGIIAVHRYHVEQYRYQTGAGATLFFEGKFFNPFMNAGGSNATIDDFNTNWAFDRAPHNFVGGYNVSGGFN